MNFTGRTRYRPYEEIAYECPGRSGNNQGGTAIMNSSLSMTGAFLCFKTNI
ncbi:hypothetical protein SAMN05216378_2931 [Paenibacillus catalpae]|uniref:Uncharacterized protein n=1 Tax=Paenibacillus catalpae TaxID=1045775 RepID=A0A1I1Z3B5_9BACL|nr:hypothetical protein SAMN05216378_2931 [Paenibacillus catalpae]